MGRGRDIKKGKRHLAKRPARSKAATTAEPGGRRRFETTECVTGSLNSILIIKPHASTERQRSSLILSRTLVGNGQQRWHRGLCISQGL